ncbi:MAG TPA: gliding motility-associated C-terminal domain-containing protein [Flavobacteriaceae bacterium]|nr:gliding motility-associated C-terminal domain-containing protein [Flavobacteriaceae bacterium]
MKFAFLFLLLFPCSIIYSQTYDVSLQQKITENESGFIGTLNLNDEFGYDVEGIGDLNGDGINDMAISARQDDDGGSDRGAVYILFLNMNGTVDSYQKISDTDGNFTGDYDNGDYFGASVSFLGDMNGDGLIEIGVGEEYDNDGGFHHGAIWILTLNSNGTVNSWVKISDIEGGFTGDLADWTVFGSDIAPLGDLNGDGNPDIAVGARRDPDGGSDRGAVWILFLNADFTVSSHQKISDTQGNFNGGLNASDYFGGAVANIGDLNNDGVIDLAVGAYRDDEGGPNHGAVYILFMNSNGTVESYQKINEIQGNFNEFFSSSEVFFGRSIDKAEDINQDGLTEIIVGAPGYEKDNQRLGAFYILNLNSNGTVASYEKYTEGLHNFTGPLNPYESFGFSVCYLGELQETHCIAVGTYKDFIEGVEKGSAWILQLGSTLAADITSTILAVNKECNSREIEINYSINNNGDGVLPAGIPVAFYADGTLIGNAVTQNEIPMGGSETGSIILTVPANIPDNFTLTLMADDDGNGTGIIAEADEGNNSDSVQIDLSFSEIANQLENLFQCDVNDDGTEIFDLTTNTPIAIGTQTNVSISYHISQNDADLNLDPIINPSDYMNIANPQEVFVRVENITNSTCYSTDSFILKTISIPQAFDPGSMTICDDLSGDGIGIFDLTSISSTITGNQNNVTVNFYENQSDANLGINPIQNPNAYQNNSNPLTIYVRVESSFFSGCFSIASLELKVEEIGSLVPFENLSHCDNGFNSAFFDLTTLEAELEPNQNITGYYLTENDAGNETNAISNPAHYQNMENPQIIYVRLDVPDGNCYQLGAIELSTSKCEIFIPEGFSPNGDGINDTFAISGIYDIFPNFELTIFSRYGNIVYEGNNNVPEWDGTRRHSSNSSGNPLPTGTYFYVLNLNDPDFEIIKSWVYLNR